ncbi:alkaline phosphatase-like [Aphis craccivora]|uniref:alkaline phosphatase n=1 Tax=Aphis craccivora TaxID=307492 RepID=A0A6G0Y543_APHCR|nr:alkaline phosphatase-like [Aphis craccivora]
MHTTYNLNAQIGESSACATALLCGVKANFETVGLDGNGKFENCYSSFASRVDSLAYWAQQQELRTFFVVLRIQQPRNCPQLDEFVSY